MPIYVQRSGEWGHGVGRASSLFEHSLTLENQIYVKRLVCVNSIVIGILVSLTTKSDNTTQCYLMFDLHLNA